MRQGDLWEVVEGLKGDEMLANSRLNELATGVSVRIGGRRVEGGGRGGQGGQGGRQGGGRRGGRAARRRGAGGGQQGGEQ